MDDSALGFLALLIPIVGIVGGLAIAALSIHHRAKLRELKYRERLAMIEKGLLPPATDPEDFRARFADSSIAERIHGDASVRYRTPGVLLIGIGLALLLFFSFAARNAGLGIGIGGGLAVIGLAFVANSLLLERRLSRSLGQLPEPPATTSGPPTAGRRVLAM